jgi:hypothetical protein
MARRLAPIILLGLRLGLRLEEQMEEGVSRVRASGEGGDGGRGGKGMTHVVSPC